VHDRMLCKDKITTSTVCRLTGWRLYLPILLSGFWTVLLVAGTGEVQCSSADKLQGSVSIPRSSVVIFPVVGEALREFGGAGPRHLRSEGIKIATHAHATVFSPLGGCVIYAGPFRDYKNVIIISVDKRSQVILVGIDRTSVVVGQCVSSGDSLGSMGNAARTAARIKRQKHEKHRYEKHQDEPRKNPTGIDVDTTGNNNHCKCEGKPAVLYLELREDGVPIDPAPLLVRAHQSDEDAYKE